MRRGSYPPYTQVQRQSIRLGGEQVELVTKPGLPAWGTTAPSTELFIEKAALQDGDTILLYGCHLGPLATWQYRNQPSLQVHLTDHNHTSLEMARQTLEANHSELASLHYSVEPPADLTEKLDAVYIQLPKGRALGRRWLVQAERALHEGGCLYLAGANDQGIQPAVRDATSLFGNGTLLAYKKGNRIAKFLKQPGQNNPPIWAGEPGIAPGSWVQFKVTINGREHTIRSLPGVFSFDHLDEGTRMLLETIKIPPGAGALDLGCGYGVIGLCVALQGVGRVHLVDNDLLAIASAKETLSLSQVRTAEAMAGDLAEPVKMNTYDMVVSNPPFHAGRAVDYQVAEALIEQSHSLLGPEGQLVIVANRFIRYDRLVRSTFGNVSILAESGKFHVLSGLKSI